MTRSSMPTLIQKIRLAIRGWNRRREEKQQEFLAKNVWSGGLQAAGVLKSVAQQRRIHNFWLTVDYLLVSGQFHHYLDVHTGVLIDSQGMVKDVRYRRVASREFK